MRPWWICVLVVACSSSEEKIPAEGAFDLNGTWRGTWSSTTTKSRGGGAEITIHHERTDVTGSAIFNGDPCFGGGQLHAALADTELSGSVTAGSVEVTLTATASEGQLDGAYSVPRVGPCVADTGTFTVLLK